jgi:hypothetical protein
MIPFTFDPLAIFFVLAVVGIALLILTHLFGLLGGAIALLLGGALLVFFTRAAIARGLADVDRVLMKMPFLGSLYQWIIRPLTYYRVDSAVMYLEAIGSAVSEAFQNAFGIEAMTSPPPPVDVPVMEKIHRRYIWF